MGFLVGSDISNGFVLRDMNEITDGSSGALDGLQLTIWNPGLWHTEGGGVFTVHQSLSAVYASLTELQLHLWERNKVTDTPGSCHLELKHGSQMLIQKHLCIKACRLYTGSFPSKC